LLSPSVTQKSTTDKLKPSHRKEIEGSAIASEITALNFENIEGGAACLFSLYALLKGNRRNKRQQRGATLKRPPKASQEDYRCFSFNPYLSPKEYKRNERLHQASRKPFRSPNLKGKPKSGTEQSDRGVEKEVQQEHSELPSENICNHSRSSPRHSSLSHWTQGAKQKRLEENSGTNREKPSVHLHITQEFYLNKNKILTWVNTYPLSSVIEGGAT